MRIHGEVTGRKATEEAAGVKRREKEKQAAGWLTSVLAASASASLRPATGKKNRDEQARCYSMGPIHIAAETQTRLEVRTTDPNSALQAKNFIPNPPSVSQTWRRHQLH